MNNSLARFQDLLRQLFQFDCADLDFGIYRILNYKREQVEDFISTRLPQIVDEAFAEYAVADRMALEQQLEQKRQEMMVEYRDQAFDEYGQLSFVFHKTRLGEQYLALRQRYAEYGVAEELETRVYNDLFTFFSRYYEDGDFISKRRYGRNETYAIPYNGEEVVLHWANKDQYYVKTGEQFKTYRFNPVLSRGEGVGDFSVAFELRNATAEQNNARGNRRYFVLAGKDPVEQVGNLLRVFFEYRPLTEREKAEYGKTQQQKPQDKLNAAAVQAVLEQVQDPTLKGWLARMAEGSEQTALGRHLTRFTRKNTSDFFVHKDLERFLLRELDFFIKNEVLLLDELIAPAPTILLEGEGWNGSNLRRHVRRARVVRRVGESLVDFLAQVEDFQRRLFEKKKFVVQTEYCATLDRIPEALWDEVLANEPQIAEWWELYALDELPEKKGFLGTGLNKDFLRHHPTLVVDTRHFSEDFKWRLLVSFDGLDDAIDGVLIKSENFQALNLLLEKHRERVKCIYIDPPYNTGNDEFIYKDNYQHSSWLTMMGDRLQLSRELLQEDGSILISIDDNEAHRLNNLLRRLYGEGNSAALLIARTNPRGRTLDQYIAKTHEYVTAFVKETLPTSISEVPKSERMLAEYDKENERGRYRELGLRNRNPVFNRKNRPNLFFPIYVNSDTGEVSLEKSQVFGVEVYPRNSQGEDDCWTWSSEKVAENLDMLVGRRVSTGAWRIFRKDYLRGESGNIATTMVKSIWLDKSINNERGKEVLRDIIGYHTIDFPKSVDLVKKCVEIGATRNSLVMDFFAGSGTTAHAVINLNREDGGKRKYVLVEMGDYFETVLLPRIKKVVFCEKWKNGKPAAGAGISQLVKYHILEQYEDTLNNLALPREKEGQLALEMFGDEYLLRYMLEFETQGSPCLLDLDEFKHPFAYRLKVQEGDETVERTVDLVETFNYLLGIDVKRAREFVAQDGILRHLRYRAVLGDKDGKRVAIVWRPVHDLEDDEAALFADQAFFEQTILPALLGAGVQPDRLLVNGPCFVEGAEAIEPEFKRLMFAGVA